MLVHRISSRVVSPSSPGSGRERDRRPGRPDMTAADRRLRRFPPTRHRWRPPPRCSRDRHHPAPQLLLRSSSLARPPPGRGPRHRAGDGHVRRLDARDRPPDAQLVRDVPLIGSCLQLVTEVDLQAFGDDLRSLRVPLDAGASPQELQGQRSRCRGVPPHRRFRSDLCVTDPSSADATPDARPPQTCAAGVRPCVRERSARSASRWRRVHAADSVPPATSLAAPLRLT